MTAPERQLENQLIEKLQELKYAYRADIRDRAALEKNFRQKFDALNHVRLSDGEFQRLLDEIVTPDVFTAAHTLRNRNSFLRDDGTPLNYTLVNIAEWCKNTFEVVSQLRVNTDYSHHRYDVILLINGQYLETAQRLRERRERPGEKIDPAVEQLDFEFVLFASAVIDYDYIMKLITEFQAKGPARSRMSREQLIGLIAADSRQRPGNETTQGIRQPRRGVITREYRQATKCDGRIVGGTTYFISPRCGYHLHLETSDPGALQALPWL